MYSKAMASLLECGKMLICIQADVTNFNFCIVSIYVSCTCTCTDLHNTCINARILMHTYLVS